MPQFDPSSYTSQIFWLAICFCLIYFSMSRVFLPRIRDILKERQDKINNNNFLSSQLQEQIDKIEETTKNLRELSISQYRISIEQSFKEISLKRESDLQNAKLKITQMIDASKVEIAKFKKDSQDDCQKIVNQLVNEIGSKFFEQKIN